MKAAATTKTTTTKTLIQGREAALTICMLKISSLTITIFNDYSKLNVSVYEQIATMFCHGT